MDLTKTKIHMSSSQPNKNILEAFKILENAESNLRAAKALIADELGGVDKASQIKYKEKIQDMRPAEAGSVQGGQIIEGVFEGQNMIGTDGKSYPVPANYASKSKLVEGDKLKLTIRDDGAFLYKQIGPMPRKRIIGRLVYEGGQYLVVTDSKTYNVLLASVTYFKLQVGQTVALLVPETEDAKWAAIENSVANSEMEKAVKEAAGEQGDATFDISAVQ